VKILLVQPAKAPVTIGGDDYHLFEPLALEYLAAPLVSEHDVKILDLRLDKDLDTTLEEFSPDVVGITAYTVHVNTVRKLFDRIRRWNPRALTVVGGHHATVVPEDFFLPSIDLVVSGDGVFIFKEIVRRLEKGTGYDGIPGVAFMRDGEWVRIDPEPLVDLDALPFPARALTAAYRKEYYAEWMKPLASIRTSKGCPYRCNFCALWKLTHGRYLKREPARIVEELAGIEEEYVFFADDESLVDVTRMKKLARLIKAEGIRKRYFLYGRSDTIARNPELLEAWRNIGLERIFVGLEFFRDEDLQYIRKGSSAGDNREAVRILQDLGLEIYASFIVRPEFTKEDFSQFIDYCRELNLNFAGFSVLTPLPGTDFYANVKDQLITHDYDLFDFIHTLLPTKLPLKEFYQEYERLFKEGISFRNGVSFLAKFPLRERLSLVAKGFRWYRTVRTAYRDYDDGGARLRSG
jgi:radical SAM superfamily enzyme YgiQ (UPF0313 family)